MDEPIQFLGYKIVAIFKRPGIFGREPFEMTQSELAGRVVALKKADLPAEVSERVLAEWPEHASTFSVYSHSKSQ